MFVLRAGQLLNPAATRHHPLLRPPGRHAGEYLLFAGTQPTGAPSCGC